MTPDVSVFAQLMCDCDSDRCSAIAKVLACGHVLARLVSNNTLPPLCRAHKSNGAPGHKDRVTQACPDARSPKVTNLAGICGNETILKAKALNDTKSGTVRKGHFLKFRTLEGDC